MSNDRGGGRTLDLTVAPQRRSGLLVWLVVLLLAAGSAYAYFFHERGDEPDPAAMSETDGRIEEITLGGLRVSIRLGADWKRGPTDGGVRFDLPLEQGSVPLSLALGDGPTARACMSRFTAPEGRVREFPGEVLFERFRWLDQKDGLGAWEVVLGVPDPKRPTTVEARHHRLWVDVRDRVVRLAYDLPEGAPESAVDRVEQVIATLRTP